jgi:tetratricopeptide (TPR) repeat protein
MVPWEQLGLVERPDHMLRCHQELYTPAVLIAPSQTTVRVVERPTVGSCTCLALVVQGASDGRGGLTDLRRLLQEELVMSHSEQDQGYALSRRQALAAIAAFPLAALTSRVLPPAEEFLPLCVAANVACNHLMNSDGLDKAHAALSCYLPVLEQLAYTGSSSYRPAAARLAAEGKRMAGCIETHRGNPQAKRRLSLEAVRLAALSGDPGVQVMALRDLALAYYYSGQIEQMRVHLQPALALLDQCPPLLQSGTLFLQAALEARLGQPQTALRLVGQAQDLFSRRADGERLPDFRFEEDNVIMWTGRVHLHLAERGRSHTSQARKAFEQSSRVKAATPPRLLAEIELDMARTALIQQDLDAFRASLGESIHLANRLGSISLRREARAIYQQVRTGHPWSAERPIKEMEDLFTARTV